MGTAHSGIPVPSLRTPPLGGTYCPDPLWNGGRGLYLSGPQTFLGALQVLTAWQAGQPAVSAAAPPPVVLPTVPEGSLPFAEVDGAVVLVQPPDDQGATPYIEVTE